MALIPDAVIVLVIAALFIRHLCLAKRLRSLEETADQILEEDELMMHQGNDMDELFAKMDSIEEKLFQLSLNMSAIEHIWLPATILVSVFIFLLLSLNADPTAVLAWRS